MEGMASEPNIKQLVMSFEKKGNRVPFTTNAYLLLK